MSVGLQSFFLQYVVMLNINVQSYTFDWFGFGFWPCMKTSKPNHKCKKKKNFHALRFNIFIYLSSTYAFLYKFFCKKKKKKKAFVKISRSVCLKKTYLSTNQVGTSSQSK